VKKGWALTAFVGPVPNRTSLDDRSLNVSLAEYMLTYDSRNDLKSADIPAVAG
jgi:hypothetical protein